MPLAAGARLGPYEITAPLGAGGMGEVYRARDTRLGRDVAIKILPDLFSADPERVARFEREARLIAQLNHPNICALYDISHAPNPASQVPDPDPIQFIVLELVDGPTLADRLAHGPIPLDEALPLARQMCEALEAAHEHGVIHRDLKPANIKLTPDGVVKVLDFGLAKAMDLNAGKQDPEHVSQSPTITSPAMATHAGVILGTAAYMSPEQAKGKPLDKRTDIWAFGCVLYEMLAGTKAFGGEDVTDTIAAVVRGEPDWKALPPVPEPVTRILRRSLEKDRKHRLSDIGDVRLEIEEAIATGASSGDNSRVSSRQRSPWRRSISIALTAGALGAAAALIPGWILDSSRSSASRPIVRFGLELSASDVLSATSRDLVAMSPSGTHLVYVANTQLYLRALDQTASRPIAGTGGSAATHGRNPFFSPDGQWIGFWQGGQLRKVAIIGGAPVAICPVQNLLGATWGADDNIVFAGGAGGVLRVSASGGTPETLVRMDAGQSAAWPEMLPGGGALLFTLASQGNWSDAQIVLVSLESGARRVLTQGSHARYAPTGHLVYGFQDSLLAVPFDVAGRRVLGSAVTLVPGIGRNAGTGVTQFSWSADGTLVYVVGSDVAEQRQLVWVDRQGHSQPIGLEPRGYLFPRLSPDGTKIAVSTVAPTSDVFVYDIQRETLIKLTTAANNTRSLWTPDGSRVTFASDRAGGWPNIYWISADGSGEAERLTTSANQQVPEAWSRDGKTLLFSEQHPDTFWDIWTLLLPDRKTELFLQTPFHDGGRAFSPDGRWLVYYSDESGKGEVYVRGYAPPGGKWPVSAGGGAEPVWSRDGREIFYRSGNKLMVVDVTLQPTFTAGKPRALFEGPYVTALPANFDVTSDGRRFVMVVQKESRSARFNVVLNWFEELRRLAPVKP